MFIDQNRFSNCICTKTVLGTKFQPNQRNYNILPFWGQNYELFKNDKLFIEQTQICKLYAIQKRFQVQNFSQIRETTIFCPFCHFGVKITNFSIIIKCSQNRIDLQILQYENCSGYKISAKSEKLQYFALFAILAVKITNFSKMNIVFKFYDTKTVHGTKFQANQRNYNICPFCHFGSQNYKLFKNEHRFQIRIHQNCSRCKILAKSKKLQYFALLVSTLQTFQK